MATVVPGMCCFSSRRAAFDCRRRLLVPWPVRGKTVVEGVVTHLALASEVRKSGENLVDW
jgi:hypothetical protein